ncbi:LamG-like jellyroll fold domain-containing protein [Haloferula rosea]|uniref:Ig-like domain-containing protein n=1 Tax=Haloferula rosea TaxID=490093 RepID=A0A934VF37_9BACT|nr:LamG-like jellyroll fold domain-containing protein [Haloferula rosea]MBK1826577.1 Ig-like domain-containing protein [Haloferula rosea]
MNRTRKTPTIPLCLPGIIAGLAILVPASVSAQTEHTATVTNSEAASFSVSAADLLQTAFDSYNGSDLSDAPGGGDTAFLGGLSPNGEASLRDGVWQNEGAQGRGAAMVQNDEFAEFSLDLTASPSGYTITGVDLYTNWGTGGGRDRIQVNVSFSLVGDPTNFDQILVQAPADPLFQYNPPSLTQGKTALSGFSIPGVAAIRFDWPASQENGGVAYSELDVFGTSTAGDIDPPTLSSSDPANGAVNVPTNTEILLTFNENIQAGAGIIDLRTVSPDASVETFDVTSSGQLVFDGQSLTITPTSPLTTGVEYYLDVPIGAIDDASGNDFAGFPAPPDASAFTFTTDDTPPAHTGKELLLNLLPTADLEIELNEPAALGTGTVTIHLASDDSILQTFNLPADASVEGDSVVIDIADLSFDTAYYVNVTAGAITDVSGNALPEVNDTTSLAVSTVSDMPSLLIHCWSFDGDASDSIGTHDGTLVGGTGFTAEGLFGGALDNGTGSANMGTSSIPASDFTAACWINPTNLTGSKHVFGTRVAGSAGAVLRLVGGGTPTVSLQSESPVVLGAPNPVNTDEWTHLAYTVDSVNGLTLFVNGTEVANDPLGTGHTVTDNFTVGRRNDVLLENFVGLIDEVRIYAEVLSASEIAALATLPSETITLEISQTGSTLAFSWNSKAGKQYDLVSSTDLSTPVASWAVYDDLVNPPYEDIPSTGALTTLSGVEKVGTTRFFAIVEEDVPVPLSEDFEGGTSIPAGWVAADNGNGTAWEAGPPTNGFPAAAANGSNCAGTNLAGDYTADADATLTSPAFAAPAGGATLSFQRYVDTEGDVGEGGPDFGSVRILDADNADAEIVDGDFPITQIEGFELGWNQLSFPLPAAALGKNIKIQFQFVSNGSSQFAGFYIDDVTVTP